MTRQPLRPLFIGHDIYRATGYGAHHPLGISRVGPVMDLCAALGWLGADSYRTSPRASPGELARFHDREYIAALEHACASGKVEHEIRVRHRIGTMENPLFPGVFERAATSVGGSIHAARLALEGRVAYHPAGGTHHGRPGHASGFCYFNDPVFAILTLLDGGVGRLLYVDLDAHHGDAVQDAFMHDARVCTISIHEDGRWPHTGRLDDRGAGRACNLPVPKGFNDAELRLLVDTVVRPLAATLAPEAVVVTCGADALAGDPLASMVLTNHALWDVVAGLAAMAPSAVVLGGGGYNPWTVARYWTGLWGRLHGDAIPAVLPERARAILAALECDLVDAEDVNAAWLTGLADPPSAAPARPEIAVLAARALDLVDRHAWPRAHRLAASLSPAH